MLTTKKLISWLIFIAIFTLSIQSCIHDEIANFSEDEPQELLSKSLWKEDTMFIKRIHDHFEKSFMISNEEINKFTTEYGIPMWEYAMTIGFERNQLYVPLTNNNHVIGVMRVLRNGKKAFYSFLKNDEALEFFETVIYNPYNYELHPQKDQKIKNTNFAKVGGYTWTCSKRLIITGWHMQGETMVIDSSLVEFCKYTYTNLNPPVDYIDVYTDGMESAGGNDDFETIQDITIDELQNYPCAHSIAQQLPNLNNSIASNMRQIFQNNTKYNIIFRAKSGLGTTDGETFATYSTEFDTFNAVINLNDEVLLNATKEYILVTMYHEVLHAFLKYQLYKLGNTEFQAQYPGVTVGYDYASNGTITNTFTFIEGHAQLVPFLTTLQNIVSQYNPNLPNNVITAISRAGITTLTPEQAQLNNNERNTLLGNNLGTKCP